MRAHCEGPTDQFKKTINESLNAIIERRNESKSVSDKFKELVGFKPKDSIIEKAEALRKESEQLLQSLQNDSSKAKANVTQLLHGFLFDIYLLIKEINETDPYGDTSSLLEVDTVKELLKILKNCGYNFGDLKKHRMQVDEREDTEKFFDEIFYKYHELSSPSQLRTDNKLAISYENITGRLDSTEVQLKEFKISKSSKQVIADKKPISQLSAQASESSKKEDQDTQQPGPQP